MHRNKSGPTCHSAANPCDSSVRKCLPACVQPPPPHAISTLLNCLSVASGAAAGRPKGLAIEATHSVLAAAHLRGAWEQGE